MKRTLKWRKEDKTRINLELDLTDMLEFITRMVTKYRINEEPLYLFGMVFNKWFPTEEEYIRKLNIDIKPIIEYKDGEFLLHA